MKPVWKTERLWKSASPMWPNHFGSSLALVSGLLGTAKDLYDGRIVSSRPDLLCEVWPIPLEAAEKIVSAVASVMRGRDRVTSWLAKLRRAEVPQPSLSGVVILLGIDLVPPNQKEKL